MKLLTLLATAVSILLPVACNMFSTEPVKKEFLNTPWQLESFVTGGDIIKPPADQLYQISFTSDSTWEGRSDCNEIFGGYQLLPDSHLKIKMFGTTEIYCGEESLDDMYDKAVYGMNAYEIRNKTLHLYYGENAELVFRTP